MDKWNIFGILLGLFLIGFGIRGVANRKIKGLAYLILSIGNICFGIFMLIAAVLFILKGTK
jgi:hypothetical protein